MGSHSGGRGPSRERDGNSIGRSGNMRREEGGGGRGGGGEERGWGGGRGVR